MELKEILKAQGLNEEALEKVAEEMKKNKIYTSSEENLDIRYGKVKKLKRRDTPSFQL